MVIKVGRQSAVQLHYVGGDSEGFFGGLVAGARRLGFEHCEYIIGVPGRDKTWKMVMMNNLPQAWRKRFRRNPESALDPTIEHAKTQCLPLIWSTDHFTLDSFSHWCNTAASLGINHGWSQPFQDSSGRFGMLTLARRVGPVSESEVQEKQVSIRWMAQVAHIAFFGVLLSKLVNESTIGLSARELDFLRLASHGLTSVEIAKIMDVTERTANFHIGNAIQKLGAMNKTHAVAMAMRAGLLE